MYRTVLVNSLNALTTQTLYKSSAVTEDDKFI